ncbi:MAG: T9SS C-terminal target domain-containing protein, partial [Bacteroidetes bacterium]
APPACNGEQITYLSDMPWVGTPENGWGVVERDRSNGELGDEDGGVITLNGVTYEKGLGAHAYSVIEYELGGQYEQFLSSVGLDDETGDGGTVQFVVMADGVEIFESPVVNGKSKAIDIELDIEGVQLLSLIMLDGGDGNGLDHGDWADARVSRCGKKPGPVSVLVYPNPTDYTKTLHIEYTQLEEHVISMELFDTQGRILYESTSAKEEYEGVLSLPVEGLGSGMYILRVSGKDWSETRRVFVR